MLLEPPLANMKQQFVGYGGLMASKYTFPAPDASVKTEDTATDKGTKVRIYTPDGYIGGRPVCMYYHGGGWAMGDINGEDGFSRAVTKAGGIVVVSVEYGLAPENAHPGLMDECFYALQWALQHSQRLNTAQSKFLTAGVSAGGQIAFGTALRAVDEGLGDQLVGVLGIIPATVHPDGVPAELKARYTAMERYDRLTLNTARAMREFWGKLSVEFSVLNILIIRQTPLEHRQLIRMLHLFYIRESRISSACIWLLLDLIH